MIQGGGLAFLEALGPQKIRPGLSRTRALLDGLGSPDRSFQTLLIAGTNGKGSTAAFASSILTAAGVCTGLYTSPHLIRVTERVRIAEMEVSAAHLDDVLEHVSHIAGAGSLAPSYFEAMTVSAFELFRRARVAVAVVEVGIGGRLDATNVLEPDVSIVTNVGADHLEVLGPSLEAVAREKAGIFRSGRPALTAERGPLLRTLEEEARRAGALLFPVPPTDRYADCCPLVGRHQRENLALAVAAAAAFCPLTEEAIRKGVASVRWPGRLQSVQREGLRPLLLDGAHNPDGARALAAWLDEAGLAQRVDLVFGGLADKDLEEVFAPLGPRVRRVVLTAPSNPRAENPRRLAARLGRPDAFCASGVGEALSHLDSEGTGDGAPIIVTGSLFLVGDALGLLERA